MRFIIWRKALYRKTAIARCWRVPDTRKHLVITAIRFHAPLLLHANPVLLDNTATSRFKERTRFIFPSSSIVRAHGRFPPERSFRRACGRFGRYLRSCREQCLSGCYRVWAQATGRTWPISWMVLRDAIMSSPPRAHVSRILPAGAARSNENYIVHYRKRSRFPNVPQVIIQ